MDEILTSMKLLGQLAQSLAFVAKWARAESRLGRQNPHLDPPTLYSKKRIVAPRKPLQSSRQKFLQFLEGCQYLYSFVFL